MVSRTECYNFIIGGWGFASQWYHTPSFVHIYRLAQTSSSWLQKTHTLDWILAACLYGHVWFGGGSPSKVSQRDVVEERPLLGGEKPKTPYGQNASMGSLQAGDVVATVNHTDWKWHAYMHKHGT